MTNRSLTSLTWILLIVAPAASGAEVTLVVTDRDAAAARVGAPVSIEVDLGQLFGRRAKAECLHLVELTAAGDGSDSPVAVQFVSDPPESARGRLWWLMTPGPNGPRRFRLSVAAQKATGRMTIRSAAAGSFDVAEGPAPVLRFNHGTVPVPQGIPAHYARGDYISPLFGPDGETLTDDYPRDHPHHRGVSWSWPVTRWKDEVRDIWAVRGVWARPVAVRRTVAGPVAAVVEAESVWKWSDRDPIVREEVVIRAFRQTGRCRFVDVEVRLTALADGVAIGGRPKAGYGGFGLRAAPADGREIIAHHDPEGAKPRRAWLDYSGLFAGGNGRSGVTIFEHVGNPDYPSELHQYPACNYVMPAFPGPREVPLKKDEPLVLKHRLWIHSGTADESTLADVWAAYADPPKIAMEN